MLSQRGAAALPDAYDVCFRHAQADSDSATSPGHRDGRRSVISAHYCGDEPIRSSFYPDFIELVSLS